MKTVETYGTFAAAIARAPEEVQALAAALRQLIVEVDPEVVEVPWPNQGVVGYGVGPKKNSEQYCYIGVYKGHVNLGFYYGVALPDEDGLLEGSGKKLRHVKVRTPEDVAHAGLRRLLEGAVTERKLALG